MKKIKQSINLINFIFILISILPISILLGSFVINSNIILIIIFFILAVFTKKISIDLKNIYYYLLYFFFATLVLNIFLSNGDKFLMDRQLGFVRYVLLVIALDHFFKLNNFKYAKKILRFWFIIFCIVTFDLYFEYIFGYDLAGNKSSMYGRLSGFLGEELKIGNFYYGFILLSMSYFLTNFKKNKLNFLLILIFIFCSLVIGERSNFIRVIIAILIFYFCINQITLKQKISFIAIFFSIIVCSTIFIKEINFRFYQQILKPIKEKGPYNYIITSHYGAHYDTAIKIFKDNKFFGVGLKQFRYESEKIKYKNNPKNIINFNNSSTHPHQIYLEFLSETGIFGTISFAIFLLTSIYFLLRAFVKNKNLYLISSTLFILTTAIPIIPSGSFFTTYSATIFWINYSVAISFSKKII